MSTAAWMTKYGRRRVRFEPPTISEALAAAEGLTSDPVEQIALAAELMQIPIEQVKVEAEKLAAAQPRHGRAPIKMVHGRGTAGTVVVERKAPRRLVGDAAARAGMLRRSS